ncbi:MAG: class I SAM-dependent methyltransferase [Nitrospirota bacterium]|nr:class I SAM-dependent methyltransferase [Nitrospirota bacterium]
MNPNVVSQPRHQVASQGAAPALLGERVYESAALRRIEERLARTPGQRVLTVGRLCGETVVSLAETGARVYVHDLLVPLLVQIDRGTVDVDQLLHQVDLPPGTLDAICLWDLPDMLPLADSARLIQRMTRLLAPRGHLTALFHVAAGDTAYRYRLSPGGLVQMEVVASRPRLLRATVNNDMLELFSALTLQNSALLRPQMRELLLQKPG